MRTFQEINETVKNVILTKNSSLRSRQVPICVMNLNSNCSLVNVLYSYIYLHYQLNTNRCSYGCSFNQHKLWIKRRLRIKSSRYHISPGWFLNTKKRFWIPLNKLRSFNNAGPNSPSRILSNPERMKKSIITVFPIVIGY